MTSWVRDLNPEWKDASTLEEYFKRCLSEGKEEECLALIRSLPEIRKAYYREIYKEAKGKK